MGLLERFRGRTQLREVPLITPRVAELRNALLSESDLFAGIERKQMVVIGERLPMATAGEGELIYTPGETPEALFLLKSGRVRIYRLASDGRKLVLETVGPGMAFGEMALIGQSMTGSFAEAIEDCTVCVMSRIDIEELMREHPPVAIRLVQLMAKRLRAAEDQMEMIAFRSVPSRLSRLLIELSKGEDEIAGFSHQDLAEMIGTSRETVSRALVEMKREGLIEIERRRVRIVSRAGLAERAAREPD